MRAACRRISRNTESLSLGEFKWKFQLPFCANLKKSFSPGTRPQWKIVLVEMQHNFLIEFFSRLKWRSFFCVLCWVGQYARKARKKNDRFPPGHFSHRVKLIFTADCPNIPFHISFFFGGGMKKGRQEGGGWLHKKTRTLKIGNWRG